MEDTPRSNFFFCNFCSVQTGFFGLVPCLFFVEMLLCVFFHVNPFLFLLLQANGDKAKCCKQWSFGTIDKEVDFSPSTAAISLLSFSLSVGGMSRAYPHHTLARTKPFLKVSNTCVHVILLKYMVFLEMVTLTSHCLLIASSCAPNFFVHVLRSTPSVFRLSARLTPSSSLYFLTPPSNNLHDTRTLLLSSFPSAVSDSFKPFFCTSAFILPKTCSAIFGSSLFLPVCSAEGDVNPFVFMGEHTFATSHKTPCITIISNE